MESANNRLNISELEILEDLNNDELDDRVKFDSCFVETNPSLDDRLKAYKLRTKLKGKARQRFRSLVAEQCDNTDWDWEYIWKEMKPSEAFRKVG